MSDQILNTNIFFFITSVVVVLLGIFIALVIFYIIRLLRIINHVADLVVEEGTKVKKDIDTVRTFAVDHGRTLTRAFHISDHFTKKKSKKRSKR